MHQRTLIRKAVIGMLTGKTAAGARVFASRVVPFRKVELPAIAVLTSNEDVDPDSADTAPRELTRELQVQIACAVADSAALRWDDAMDALALEIEAVMEGDRYLSDTAAESILESTEITTRDEGDTLIATAVLTYSVTYRTTAGVTPTDDFLRAGVETRVDGATDNNAAHDVVNVQETP